MNDKALKILEFYKVIDIIKNLAVSELGKAKIDKITPADNFNDVKSLLKEAEDTVVFVRRRGIPSIDGIADIKNSLRRAELGGVLNPAEFIKICDNMKVARRLKDYLSQDNIESQDNSVEELINSLYQNKRLEERINSVILNEEEISDHASPALSSIRRQITLLQSNVKDKLNDIIRSSKYQKFIQESVVTMRGERYVIPVKQECRSEIPGLIHDASASGATIFVEPMAVVEINNNIKQAKIKEQAEIERILRELTQDVLAVVDGLGANISLLAQIDFLFAKARFALELKCICPRLNNDKKMRIVEGRHPLLNQEKVVPVDFWIGETFTSLIVTGPNTGGKTVSLKTVGLFVIMTQSGILIPAKEGTSMCIFKNIYADIGDEQSIEQSLSTFSSHMKNIVYILNNATSFDLTLFDELGAGTDPSEGAALAISILEFLLNKKITTIATTHYSELKTFALSHPGIENASCEFNVETLMPTYKLLIGIPGKSNAFSISKKLGLMETILVRAKEFISSDEIQFEDVLSTLEKNLSEARKEREEARKILSEAQQAKEEISQQKEKMQERKDKILENAREDARKIIREAVSEIDVLIKDIKDNQKKQSEEHRLNSARELKQDFMKRLKSANQALSGNNGMEEDDEQYSLEYLIENIREGDDVIIKSLNQPAKVISKPNKKGEMTVMAGLMKMNLNVSNIKLLKKLSKKEKPKNSGFADIAKSKARETKSELDFRGYTTDDAVLELDKYLDDAQITGLRELRIIHGKGTGALRNGIHSYLKRNPHVSSYRLGVYGEGDHGVTIVEIK